MEEIFGWIKTVGGGRKLRFIGLARNQSWAELTAGPQSGAAGASNQSPGPCLTSPPSPPGTQDGPKPERDGDNIRGVPARIWPQRTFFSSLFKACSIAEFLSHSSEDFTHIRTNCGVIAS